jgi:hypothetical protein
MNYGTAAAHRRRPSSFFLFSPKTKSAFPNQSRLPHSSFITSYL